MNQYSQTARINFGVDWSEVSVSKVSLTLRKDFQGSLPITFSLLNAAEVYALRIREVDYIMVGWKKKEGGRSDRYVKGPGLGVGRHISISHRLLSGAIGGIVDYWGDDFDHLLVNQRFFASVTLGESVNVSAVLTAYAPPPPLPFNANTVVVSEEYNGNLAFYTMPGEDVYYFAPDHCDPLLIPFDLPYDWALHKKASIPTFSVMIEKLSMQWQAQLRDLTEDDASGWRDYLEFLKDLAEDKAEQERKGFETMCQGWLLGTDAWKKAMIKERAHLKLTAGIDRAQARQLKEERWEQRLAELLQECGKGPVEEGPKNQKWKLEIALRLRQEEGASASWLAHAMYLGTPATARNYLSSQRREQK